MTSTMFRIAALCVLWLVSGCAGTSTEAQSAAAFVREIPWAGKGVWLRADTHIHTNFSDGSHPVDEIAAKAVENGLDVIAITDHLDRNLKGASPEYFAAINAARQKYPQLTILAGGEWNLPPWGGDDHAVILLPRDLEGLLEDFKARFDDLDRVPHEAALATEALRWLQARTSSQGISPVIIYEHPSRANDRSIEGADNLRRWRSVNDLVIGFAGAPGHQGKPPIGGYKYKEVTIDRWDPVVARVGDAWDTLLQEGLQVWGAYAPSDFHNAIPEDLNDFWPGQFSSTWLYAPERTQSGVLQALRAGSFFADHGQIAQEAHLLVSAAGLAREAVAGEVLRMRAGESARVTVRVTPRPTKEIDSVELIGITRAGARVVKSERPTNGSIQHSETVPPGGIVFRARGYQSLPDGTRLAFYTNQVRIETN